MKNGKQPAFAVSAEMCEMSEITGYPYGLTKREYFAGLAMQGLLSIFDEEKGIVPNLENCIPCCTSCNYAKHKLTQDEFYEKIRKIYKHLNL